MIFPSHESRRVTAQFSASGWFKAPTQESAWWTVASKKVGITTGPNGQNLWNIDKGWYLELPQSRTKLNLNYTTSAGMTVPDAAANWNYFQIVSDGSTLKGYVSGSITNAKGDTVSTDVGTVSVTLDSTSTWTLTGDSYITEFNGDASNVISNGYTLYVNGTALTGTK